MSKKIRHIHAKSNEYIKIHRNHKDSGNKFIAVLVIIGCILFFIFWKQILMFLAFIAILGLFGWIICHFHSEIFSGIIGFFKLMYKFVTWIFKKKSSAANTVIPKQNNIQFVGYSDTDYGKVIQKH